MGLGEKDPEAGDDAQSSSNSPRRFVFSTNYDLPFGKTHRLASKGFSSYLLGGWQTSVIWAVQDGSPFTVRLSQDNANVGNTSWPDRVCSGKLENARIVEQITALLIGLNIRHKGHGGVRITGLPDAAYKTRAKLG